MLAAILAGLLCGAPPAHSAQDAQPVPDAASGDGEATADTARLNTGDILRVDFMVDPRAGADGYRIEAGDVLRIDFAERSEYNRDRVAVMPDGRIMLSGVGPVQAQGLLPSEASDRIAELYAKAGFEAPRVSVEVEQSHQRIRDFIDMVRGQNGGGYQVAIYAHEQVDMPLIGEVDTGVSLRRFRQTVRDRYRKVFGDALIVSVNFQVRSLPEVAVSGEVREPGGFQWGTSATVPQAIAKAGGFTEVADRKRIQIYRTDPDTGKLEVEAVDFDQAIAPKADPEKLRLWPGDIVVVARAPTFR